MPSCNKIDSAVSEIRAQRIRLAMADVDKSRNDLQLLLKSVDRSLALKILATIAELERALIHELTLRRSAP